MLPSHTYFIMIVYIAGAQNGEVQLGFYLCKGALEVEVICARDICLEEKEELGNLKGSMCAALLYCY